MTRRDLASVLIGVSGLYIAGTRLSELFLYLPALTGAVEFVGDPAYLYAAFGERVVSLLLGIALIFLRHAIATRLFPDAPAARPPASPHDWQAVGFSIVGLYFVIQGMGRAALSWGQLDPQSLVLILFGSVAFLGASGLSNLWRLIRGRSS